MTDLSNITADAIAIQERDSFCAAGWQKVIAPAKVNLFLAVGGKLENGYHEVSTVMHVLNLHDVVYLRRKMPSAETAGTGQPDVTMVSTADIALPAIDSRDNLVTKAVNAFSDAMGLGSSGREVELRVEKNIPFQAGLGGASADAAATLVAMAQLHGQMPDGELLQDLASGLGADVAFFLQGGCALMEGAGDRFVHRLEPMKSPVALIKPDGGVSTAQAYEAFDTIPSQVYEQLINEVRQATAAEDVPVVNNLSDAAESLMPELAAVRLWLSEQPQVTQSLLCGSGACTFALCESFAGACDVVAAARLQGWWARATSLSSVRALALGGGV